MSLKPLKKSDLSKSWMQPRRDSKRKLQPEYHLIVTEGTDTEPAYFGTIKDRINRMYPDRIHLDVFGEGDNTLSLFERARKRADASANGYKHVWIVYDTDDFPASHINQTAQLCRKHSCEETETIFIIKLQVCHNLTRGFLASENNYNEPSFYNLKNSFHEIPPKTGDVVKNTLKKPFFPMSNNIGVFGCFLCCLTTSPFYLILSRIFLYK